MRCPRLSDGIAATASALTVLEVYATSLLVHLELLVRPASGSLGLPELLPSGGRCSGSEAVADRLRWLVDACPRRWPLRGSCLVRALVVRRMLRRRGIPCQLVISLRTFEGRLVAHAEARVPPASDAAASVVLVGGQ